MLTNKDIARIRHEYVALGKEQTISPGIKEKINT
jgi:hypothetical protein